VKQKESAMKTSQAPAGDIYETGNGVDCVESDTTQKRILIADVPSAGSLANFCSAVSLSTQSPSQTYSWPLGQGVSAEVGIIGGELPPEYFDALRQYLALAEKLVKPVFQEGDKVEYVDAYTGETRYGTIERMYGSNAIVHTVTKEEAGLTPMKFTSQR
jgi:hypothetical protein